MYRVEFTSKAIKSLKKIDKKAQALLLAWIEKNLVTCNNPYLYGKSLVENHMQEWSYRIGDYRIIADIQEDKILILVLDIGHRKNIYGGH